MPYSALGASTGHTPGAGAAFYALIGVDYVFAVALADSADGAFSRAGAAGDAIITDLVCHSSLPPYENDYIVAQMQRYASAF